MHLMKITSLHGWLTMLNGIHSSVGDFYHLIQNDEGCLRRREEMREGEERVRREERRRSHQ